MADNNFGQTNIAAGNEMAEMGGEEVEQNEVLDLQQQKIAADQLKIQKRDEGLGKIPAVGGILKGVADLETLTSKKAKNLTREQRKAMEKNVGGAAIDVGAAIASGGAGGAAAGAEGAAGGAAKVGTARAGAGAMGERGLAGLKTKPLGSELANLGEQQGASRELEQMKNQERQIGGAKETGGIKDKLTGMAVDKLKGVVGKALVSKVKMAKRLRLLVMAAPVILAIIAAIFLIILLIYLYNNPCEAIKILGGSWFTSLFGKTCDVITG